MGYFQDWTAAKKKFEQKTGESKPSDKFMGFFRKSSGLEKACKGLDDSLAKKSLKGMQDAEAAYREASKSYSTLLMQTSTQDKGANFKSQLRELEQKLYDIADDFVKEREKYVESQFKLCKADMGKYERTISTIFTNIMALLAKADTQYHVCDSQLRDLSLALAQRDQVSAKKAIVNLNNAIKTLATQVNLIEKTYVETDKKVKSNLVNWKKNNKELLAAKEDEANDLEGAIQNLTQAMEVKVEMAKELMNDGKELLVTAAKAMKEGVDIDKVFESSINKFANRVENIAGNCERDAAALDGEFDMANFEYMHIEEENVQEPERGQRLAGVENAVTGLLKQVAVVRDRVTKAKEALEKEWEAYPEDVRDNPKFATDLVAQAFRRLDGSLQDVDTAETKLNKLMRKVKK